MEIGQWTGRPNSQKPRQRYAAGARLGGGGFIADGVIVIKPVGSVKVELEQLLSRIDEENLHGEVDMGLAIEAEAW